MLGHLKPSTCQLSAPAKAQYRNYYCSICASLRKENSLGYSLLINNELTLVLSALNPYIKEAKSIETPCPAMAFTKKNQASVHEAINVAGRISVLLGWVKVTDWQADNPKFYKKYIKSKLEKKAKKILPSISPQFRDVLGEYVELTQSDSTDYEMVRSYSGLMSEFSVREIALSTDVPTDKLDEIANLFREAGELISLADHLTDLDQDMMLGHYNPIFHQAQSNKSSLSEEYHKLLLAFNRKKLLLRDMNKVLLSQEITDSLFSQAFILSLKQIESEVKSKKPQFLSNSPVDELIFQVVMSDIVAIDACCDASPQISGCCCHNGGGGGCQCCHGGGGGGGCHCCNGGGSGCQCCHGGGGGCQCDGCCQNCGNGCKGCGNCCDGCGNGCKGCGGSCNNCCNGCNGCDCPCGDSCKGCNNNCDCGKSCKGCDNCCECSGGDCCNNGSSHTPYYETKEELIKNMIENLSDSLSDAERQQYYEKLDTIFKNDPESSEILKKIIEENNKK